MNEEVFKLALAKLNAEQIDAVQSIEGPTVVLAGPGTGKTQIIALRIANILQTTDVYPANILALTFTESGVKAMRERLTSIIGSDAYDVCISTFHGFCNKVVSEFPEKFAFRKELSAIDDIATFELIREIVSKNSFQNIVSPKNKFYNVKTIIADIKALKQEGISVEDARNFLKNKFELHLRSEPPVGSLKKDVNEYTKEHKKLLCFEELIKVYSDYQLYLRENSLFDFADMIRFVVDRFEKDNDLLSFYQEQYLYIHADEFQDSNGSQIQLLNHLISGFEDSPNIFVVGDDDQSIYRFQGASIQNFSNFIEQFSDCKKITLRQNYRSTQLILDAAKSVINSNEIRIDHDKNLVANVDYANLNIELSHFSTQIEESQYLIDKVKELISSGVVPSEIAVLTRNNSELQELAAVFENNAIQYSLAVSTDILQNKYVKIIISLLRVLNDPSNFNDFIRLLFLPYLEIDSLTIHTLARKIKKGEYSSIFELKDVDNESLVKLVNNISDSYKDFSIDTLSNAFLKCLNEIGLIEYLGLSIERMDDFNALNNFISFIKSLQSNRSNYALSDLLNTIDSILDHDLKIPQKTVLDAINSVQLLTVHKSKGLEFEYVFVPYTTDKKWRKGRQSRTYILEDITDSKVEHLNVEEEESRRLFYVALTRAKKQIFISNAISYDSITSEQELAKFAVEIDRKFVTEIKHEGLTQRELTKIFSTKANTAFKVQSEKDKIRFLVENNFKLSASSLNSYLKCKREFFLSRILGVPSVQTYSLTKGNILHALAEKFVGPVASFTRDEIVSYVKNTPQAKSLSKIDFEEMVGDVSNTFVEWYEFNQDKGILPSPIHKELNFSGRQTYFEGVPISGSIDLVELLDKDSREVRIVDYKTGSVKSKNVMLGHTGKDGPIEYRQLMFYKLLLESDPSIKLIPAKATVYFMSKNSSGNYQYFDFDFNETDYEEFKNLVKNVYTEILNLEFLDFEKDHKCKKCNFDYL